MARSFTPRDARDEALHDIQPPVRTRRISNRPATVRRASLDTPKQKTATDVSVDLPTVRTSSALRGRIFAIASPLVLQLDQPRCVPHGMAKPLGIGLGLGADRRDNRSVSETPIQRPKEAPAGRGMKLTKLGGSLDLATVWKGL